MKMKTQSINLDEQIKERRHTVGRNTFYRTRSEILLSMLEAIANRKANEGNGDAGGLPKTKIMFSAFISYQQLKKYLKLLIDNGMIQEINTENIPKRLKKNMHTNTEYVITEKGLQYVRTFHEIKSMVDLTKS